MSRVTRSAGPLPGDYRIRALIPLPDRPPGSHT